MARYRLAVAACAALGVVLTAKAPALGRDVPEREDGEPGASPEDRAALDPSVRETREFLLAMRRLRSRYAEEKKALEEERERRLRPKTPAAAPEVSRYGTDFAALPLQAKLLTMQQDASSDALKSAQERRERMIAYQKGLDEKTRRFDAALAQFPARLVKSGEPEGLVDSFRERWLRPGDSFHHDQLLMTYFESGLPAELVEDFLREAYAEFQKTPHAARWAASSAAAKQR